MNLPQSHPTGLAGEPGPDAKIWHGHMADDVGATYGPEPLAQLSASGAGITLAGPRGTFRIPQNSVRKVGRGGMYPWFFSAVRIHHAVTGYPASLQFKPLGASPKQVLEGLYALGYKRA